MMALPSGCCASLLLVLPPISLDAPVDDGPDAPVGCPYLVASAQDGSLRTQRKGTDHPRAGPLDPGFVVWRSCRLWDLRSAVVNARLLVPWSMVRPSSVVHASTTARPNTTLEILTLLRVRPEKLPSIRQSLAPRDGADRSLMPLMHRVSEVLIRKALAIFQLSCLGGEPVPGVSLGRILRLALSDGIGRKVRPSSSLRDRLRR